MDVEEIVNEVCNDQKYFHAVFGCFDMIGHFIQETKGTMENVRKYAWCEDEYSESFKSAFNRSEFVAKVHGEIVSEGFKLKLMYNDRKGDYRVSSHTDYMLLIPQSEVANIMPVIKEDPSLMITIFQKIFPNYDRSEGKLKLDSENFDMIKY